MKTTVKDLIKKGHLVNNAKEAAACEMVAYYEEAKGTKIEYKSPEGYYEPLISIDKYDDGGLMAITVQGREHVGEFDIKNENTKIDVTVFTKSK